jgi:hypothetical protein
MPDLLIPDLDETVVARLQAAAERRGLGLGALVVEMLDSCFGKSDAGVVEEIAAMRALQPKQDGDAVQDIRRLRDGGDEPPEATRAA